ncbi:hypothetical protein VTJ83DRAFT_1276 [Remersonia thermophila]|uniref:Glycoside hydrolase family 5 domain-containing protein n=1 Tax=Remersonia thermophila TaxID=72144 RepID=A0ABR4DP70_9PEZI
MARFLLLRHLLAVTLLLALPLASAASTNTTLPALPLRTASRWILDAAGARVKFRCINWAGHMETHLPEGLQHQSVDFITTWIASQGFNCVRLTYSTDFALDPGRTINAAFSAAASPAGVSAADMEALRKKVVDRNPWIDPQKTTTWDVFAKVVDLLAEKGVMTILDNHVSRAGWCCNLEDGNGWWDAGLGYNHWNSRYFNTGQWLAGLQAMAAWAKGRRGVVGMSLRNEVREFLLQGTFNKREDWYRYMKEGGDLVHATNPDVLVIVGGTQSSTDLLHLRTGDKRMLDTSGWKGKHVWEMHAYSFTVTFPDPFRSCDMVKAQYGLFGGFVLEQGKEYTGPLFLSEFGVGMEGGPANGLSEKDDRYLKCMVSWLESNDADWAIWAIQGSYYARDKRADADESWGAMNHNFSGWRNPAFPAMLKGMWNMTQTP